MREPTGYASSPCAATKADWGFSQTPATLVLAGGRGARIGGAKPERLLGGLRLVDHAYRAARRYSGRIAVGVRAADQVNATTDMKIVLDNPGIEGPLASLAAGLAWAKECGAELLLTLPCDAPFLPHDLCARLQTRLQNGASVVALPASHGRAHPACGLWRTAAIRELPIYLLGGRRSLLGFAEHLGHAIEDWGAPTRDPFFNVNTPEDLSIAEAWLAQPHRE